MRYISLFSGIGGFDLGFERAGMTCVGQVELNEFSQRVLARHWPFTPAWRDVKDVGRHNLCTADLICGGFPCQDVSVAGKRAGLAGKQSSLWFEFHRVLAEVTPEWVVIENVPGLLSSNRGRDFATVLQGLVGIGYRVGWRILDSQYFGVAQRRRRVFIVGHLTSGGAAQVLFEPEGSAGDFEARGEAREGIANTLTAGTPSRRNGGSRPTAGHLVVAGTLSAEHGRNRDLGNANETDLLVATETGKGYWRLNDNQAGSLITHNAKSPTDLIAMDVQGRNISPALTAAGADAGEDGRGRHAFAIQNGVRRLTPTECERLQGFPDGWTEGQSDSMRYRQLGLAVTVNVAEWLGKRILRETKNAVGGKVTALS